MYELINMYVLMHVFLIGISLYTFLKLGKDIVTVREAQLFKLLIGTCCLYMVTAAVWSLMEYGVLKAPEWVFVLNSSLSYAGLTFLSFWLYLFVMTRHDFSVSENKWFWITSFIPIIGVVVLLIVSSFTGIVFTISANENGECHLNNGPLYIVMTVVAMSYFFAIFIASLVGAIKTPSTIKRKEYKTLCFSMAVLFVSVLGLSPLFKQLTILPMTIFAAIYIIFINLQESGINKDALTGLNNRRRANEYLREKRENATEQQSLVLFLCDVNYFKEINDKYGHTEGDKALIITADAIKKTVSEYSGFASRYGGDEFLFTIKQQILIAAGTAPEQVVEKLTENLNVLCERQNKPYRVSVSVGFVVCDDQKKPSGYFFGQADEMLYKVKREYHEKAARR